MRQLLLLYALFCSTSLLRAQDFDPAHPDYELLRSKVLDKLNERRTLRHRQGMSGHAVLQLTADQYTARLRATRLENTSDNRQRVHKKIRKNARLNGYKNAFIDFHIASLTAINYGGSRFYYDRLDEDTQIHLFEGKRPSKKEKEAPSYKAVPLRLYTYDQLAGLIVSRFSTDDGTFKSLNNGYDKIGISMAVEKNTLFRNKKPVLKIIVVLGGSRISW